MPTVVFPGQLVGQPGGEISIDIDARTYRAAVEELLDRFPDLQSEELARYAVAIDDELIADPLLESLASDSELIFVPKISGG